ncbi:hypothetical protein ACPCAJ_21235 [Streptomyces griseoincarnatus]
MRTLPTLTAVLLAAATLTACNSGDDCRALAVPAPAAQIAPQAAPERPSGGTSGSGRSSGSRALHTAADAKETEAPELALRWRWLANDLGDALDKLPAPRQDTDK